MHDNFVLRYKLREVFRLLLFRFEGNQIKLLTMGNINKKPDQRYTYKYVFLHGLRQKEGE